MAFELTYTDCSAETYQEIQSIIARWNEQAPQYTVHTSGSTGTPKPIHLRRGQLEASAKRSNAFFGLTNKSRVLMPLSPMTIGGKMMLIRALVGNYAVHVVEPRANPLAEIHSKSRYSFISLVPYQIRSILEENPEKLDLFDQVLLGGMGLSSHLEEMISRLKPSIYIGFGMTETVSHIALRKMGSPVYEALDGVELSVSADCLVVTDNKLGIDRLKTNDLVRLIDPTHFEWLGRADFVINSGGIKIHPENIEQAIDEFIETPFIIGGIPHSSFGEECVLVLEKALPESQFSQIQDFIREKFGKYALPKRQVVAPILKTANGKIRRKDTLKTLLK
jgi:O-succinylbenzoic acid--CoA ligase